MYRLLGVVELVPMRLDQKERKIIMSKYEQRLQAVINSVKNLIVDSAEFRTLKRMKPKIVAYAPLESNKEWYRIIGADYKDLKSAKAFKKSCNDKGYQCELLDLSRSAKIK